MDKKEIDYICNVLRHGTVAWSGRKECLKRSRKHFRVGTYKNGNPKMKYKYLCAKCNNYFDSNEIEVDHIEEVDSFNGCFDDFVKRLYCRQDNLQVLCSKCHAQKTAGFMSRKNWARKTKE